MFQRLQSKRLQSRFFKGKAIILYGPRQVGKTTLINSLLSGMKHKVLSLNCDNPDVREALDNQNESSLKQLVGSKEIMFIDEAQRVKNIGITIKILVDTLPHIQVIASGSSALELANEINEPLTGRKYSLRLFPISLKELMPDGIHQLSFRRELDDLLRFGSYPEVLLQSGSTEREELVRELAGDSLFKDIYSLQQLKNPTVLRNLLKALALQIGSEVSNNELSGMLGIDKNTVEAYLDMLEKNFIVFRIPSFSRNLRNELKKSKKVYFLDLGIRNALINNFNDLKHRSDVGALWENFCIVERLKVQEYEPLPSNNYFWRTYDQAEIDWIEERSGKLHAFEMKWSSLKKAKPPSSWLKAYENSQWNVISPDNIKALLTK